MKATAHDVDEAAQLVYRECLETLQRASVPHLVGGAFAVESYTGLVRRTKDLDVFARPDQVDAVLSTLTQAGYRTEIRFAHWWFEHAEPAMVLDVPVRLVPPEEMFWFKAFIMERERYDGGDIAHLLRVRGRTLDWPRVLFRFHHHWRVLLSHIVLFGFIYPGHRLTIPKWLMDELLRRLEREMTSVPADERVCQGTLLSWSQYLIHQHNGDYEDARHAPRGMLDSEQTTRITKILLQEQQPAEYHPGCGSEEGG